MKIAIVNNSVPFVYGGAEFLADSLKDKLIEHGHQAVVIKVPFKWHPAEAILDNMLACRLLRIRNVDRVIALKFPAYYVDHPDKVLWLLHQFRQAYDLWGTPYQDIPSTPEGLAVRQAIINMDNTYLGQVKKIYTNSSVVSSRLMKYNGIGSEVLFPPLMDAHKFYCGDYGDYIFYPSRITGGKRQLLAVESMKHTRTNVRLVIAGSPETPDDLDRIETMIRKDNLGSKVEILGRFISQEEKADLFAGSLGCVYLPYDEDSYGYVTLEAYASGKPVITCNDSGGTLEVVEDGVTGFVAPPDPMALAAAMDKLYEDRQMAKKMGMAGVCKVDSMGISWDNVIRRLTG
jgi:glycosyltransferase involved in cell wall biosynthesis